MMSSSSGGTSLLIARCSAGVNSSPKGRPAMISKSTVAQRENVVALFVQSSAPRPRTETKLQNLDRPFRSDDDVRGGQMAMNDADGVGFRESIGHLNRVVMARRALQSTATGDHSLQRLAGNEFHRQKQHAIVVADFEDDWQCWDG